MAQEFDNSFVQFARAQSATTRDTLLALPFGLEQQQRFAAMAQQSVQEQKKIEAADTMPFEVYRELYVSPERLEVREAALEAH